jgi:hypothetical protein
MLCRDHTVWTNEAIWCRGRHLCCSNRGNGTRDCMGGTRASEIRRVCSPAGGELSRRCLLVADRCVRCSGAGTSADDIRQLLSAENARLRGTHTELDSVLT